MGSDFTNFDAGCHGPVPLRGLFRGRTSRERTRPLDQARDERAQNFQTEISLREKDRVSHRLSQHAPSRSGSSVLSGASV